SNNQVLKYFSDLRQYSKEPVHILISAIEHSSVNVTMEYLRSYGVEYDVIPVDQDGYINLAQYQTLFKSYTKLVSIVFGNNEIGTIQDIKKLTEIAHEKGAMFHTDAVQVLGKHDFNVTDLDVDFMSFSSHKIYAPKGVGALYVKDESKMLPLLHGGFHERGLRASTENVPGIIAFGVAVTHLDVARYEVHTRSLINYLKNELLKMTGTIINGVNSELSLSNTLNITFQGCSGYALAMNCDLEGIALSTGSACSVGSIEPSHVLAALGVAVEDNKSSIRISLGLTNTMDEMVRLVSVVKMIVERLRSC
ncbi:cysteine desulfurase NifS, partial [bacterium]|nr:cysteine desulfurase NifS [bacterium]